MYSLNSGDMLCIVLAPSVIFEIGDDALYFSKVLFLKLPSNDKHLCV